MELEIDAVGGPLRPAHDLRLLPRPYRFLSFPLRPHLTPFLHMLTPQPPQTERMEKCLASTKANFGTIRTGRAAPNMLDRIEVEYYGAMTPIKSVAGISVTDSSTLQIQPFDSSALGAIEKAIMQSDLGLTPNNDGRVIRLRIPELTEVQTPPITFAPSPHLLSKRSFL